MTKREKAWATLIGRVIGLVFITAMIRAGAQMHSIELNPGGLFLHLKKEREPQPEKPVGRRWQDAVRGL